MAHPPHRPFESLDWYRDAARRGFAEDARSIDVVQLVTGFTVLRAHVSAYAITIVALMVVNLLRTPEDIWVVRWIMAWTVLLLLHAVGVGIIWGVRLWNAEDPEQPVRVDPSWQQSATIGWGPPGASAPEPQDVPYRVTGTVEAEPAAEASSNWSGWQEAAAQPAPPDTERASWSEASAAAWLARKPQAGKQEPAAPEATPET